MGRGRSGGEGVQLDEDIHPNRQHKAHGSNLQRHHSLVCNRKATPQLFCWKPGNFVDRYTYLSPQALRRQLEGVVCREGLRAVKRDSLRNSHSTIFWNMVWYCSRLGLPLFIEGKHVAATSGMKTEILSPFDVLVCGNLSTFDGSVGIVGVAREKVVSVLPCGAGLFALPVNARTREWKGGASSALPYSARPRPALHCSILLGCSRPVLTVAPLHPVNDRPQAKTSNR